MRRAHLFGTKSQTVQPIRTLPALKGREVKDGTGRGREWGLGGGVDCWWLVAKRERRERRGKEGGREAVGETGTVCGAGRRHVISQTDKFQSSPKAKSRGY